MSDNHKARELSAQLGENLPRLVKIMRRLLAEDGCPWDRKQTFDTLKKYVIEEAYEVVDAIERGRRDDLREELGDLLLQVVFQAELARKEGSFGPDDVVDAICDKLVRRHPHVFGEAKVKDAEEVLQRWEQIKATEHENRSLLESVPRSLPSLSRAQRMGDKASRVGFDWPDDRGAFSKVEEELRELREAIDGGDKQHARHELGDLLFAVVNLARHIDVDAEEALRETNDKFQRRFRYVEQSVERDFGGFERQDSEAIPPKTLDMYWDEAKRLEGTGDGRQSK